MCVDMRKTCIRLFLSRDSHAGSLSRKPVLQKHCKKDHGSSVREPRRFLHGTGAQQSK